METRMKKREANATYCRKKDTRESLNSRLSTGALVLTEGRDKSRVKTEDYAKPSSCGLKMPSLTCKDSLTFKLGWRPVCKYMLVSIPIQRALQHECKSKQAFESPSSLWYLKLRTYLNSACLNWVFWYCLVLKIEHTFWGDICHTGVFQQRCVSGVAAASCSQLSESCGTSGAAKYEWQSQGTLQQGSESWLASRDCITKPQRKVKE